MHALNLIDRQTPLQVEAAQHACHPKYAQEQLPFGFPCLRAGAYVERFDLEIVATLQQ